MVKLGFIVEGRTEKIVLEKSDFFNHLRTSNIDFIAEIEDAGGNGNLLPDNLVKYTESLESQGATLIFILTDLDSDKCITETKKRISPPDNHIVVISIREIEAWFLADTGAMQSFLKDSTFYCIEPESINDPFTEIKNRRILRNGRGVDDKSILANLLIKKNGFSILKAAQHPNCSSAKYFLNKIKEVSQPLQTL